jgi:hypothetical protein
VAAKIAINGHSWKSRVAIMRGRYLLGLSNANRRDADPPDRQGATLASKPGAGGAYRIPQDSEPRSRVPASREMDFERLCPGLSGGLIRIQNRG